MIALRPNQILVSRSGRKVAFVRREVFTIAVGEDSRKKVLRVPVGEGEERIVVRTLIPVRDNTGKWWPGQELNGRYTDKDIEDGVLTPTDETAPDEVPQEEVVSKSAKKHPKPPKEKPMEAPSPRAVALVAVTAAAKPLGDPDASPSPIYPSGAPVASALQPETPVDRPTFADLPTTERKTKTPPQDGLFMFAERIPISFRDRIKAAAKAAPGGRSAWLAQALDKVLEQDGF